LIKDLRMLGRDIKKIIIIDNVAENFQFQPENGIFINSWFNDMNDDSLVKLLPLLKEIVIQKVDDVRIALRQYRDQTMRLIESGQPISS